MMKKRDFSFVDFRWKFRICFFPTISNENKRSQNITFQLVHYFFSVKIQIQIIFLQKYMPHLTKFIYWVFFSLEISNDFQLKSTKLKSRFFIIFEHVHYFFSVKIQIQRFFFSLEISIEHQRSKIASLEFDSNSNYPQNESN